MTGDSDIKAQCPRCRKFVSAKSAYKGMMIQCPHCRTAIIVPPSLLAPSQSPVNAAPGPATEKAFALADAEHQAHVEIVRRLRAGATNKSKQIESLDTQIESLSGRQKTLAIDERFAASRLEAHRRELSWLGAIESSVTRLGGLLIAAAIGGALTAVAASLVKAPTGTTAWFIIFGSSPGRSRGHRSSGGRHSGSYRK